MRCVENNVPAHPCHFISWQPTIFLSCCCHCLWLLCKNDCWMMNDCILDSVFFGERKHIWLNHYTEIIVLNETWFFFLFDPSSVLQVTKECVCFLSFLLLLFWNKLMSGKWCKPKWAMFIVATGYLKMFLLCCHSFLGTTLQTLIPCFVALYYNTFHNPSIHHGEVPSRSTGRCSD